MISNIKQNVHNDSFFCISNILKHHRHDAIAVTNVRFTIHDALNCCRHDYSAKKSNLKAASHALFTAMYYAMTINPRWQTVKIVQCI